MYTRTHTHTFTRATWLAATEMFWGKCQLAAWCESASLSCYRARFEQIRPACSPPQAVLPTAFRIRTRSWLLITRSRSTSAGSHCAVSDLSPFWGRASLKWASLPLRCLQSKSYAALIALIFIINCRIMQISLCVFAFGNRIINKDL